MSVRIIYSKETKLLIVRNSNTKFKADCVAKFMQVKIIFLHFKKNGSLGNYKSWSYIVLLYKVLLV